MVLSYIAAGLHAARGADQHADRASSSGSSGCGSRSTSSTRSPRSIEQAGRRRRSAAAGARSSFDERRVQLPDAAGRAQGRLVHGPGRDGRSRSSARPAPASRRWSSLLPRFYDAERGPRPASTASTRATSTLESLRSQFSIVLQEPLLFSGTIADNIRYGKPDATDEEIERGGAGRERARLHQRACPRATRRCSGERGAKISGGERQRIAVARAFLRDAPILILDEPTSSIDSRTEAVILEALDRLMEGRTTIVIAHRLSTIRSVDEILVMSDGELVAAGHPRGARRARPASTASCGRRRPASSAPRPPRPSAPARSSRPPSSRRGLAGRAGGGADARATPGAEPARRCRAPPRAGLEPAGQLGGQTAEDRPARDADARSRSAGSPGSSASTPTGFQRLGYDVYYVEAHARTPSMFMRHADDDGTATRRRVPRRDRRALRARRPLGVPGAARRRPLLRHERASSSTRLYRDAALIINMHGGTAAAARARRHRPARLPRHRPGRARARGRTTATSSAIEFLEQHVAHSSPGGSTTATPTACCRGRGRSRSSRARRRWCSTSGTTTSFPTARPSRRSATGARTTARSTFEGRTYTWSKHQRVPQDPRPAAAASSRRSSSRSSSYERRRPAAARGARLARAARAPSSRSDLDTYRDYIIGSAGEFSVAKEQNVHFRSGWFSERSATYLAAGRPVVLQDTGFGNALPTGEGLFAFSRPGRGGRRRSSAIAGRPGAPSARRPRDRPRVPQLRRRARRHARPRRARVPGGGGPRRELTGAGGAAARPRASSRAPGGRSSSPTRRVEHVLDRPVPTVRTGGGEPRRRASSCRCSTTSPARGWRSRACSPTPTTSRYELRRRRQRLRPADPPVPRGARRAQRPRSGHPQRATTAGFAAACNQGLTAARGDVLVLLNNDTIVPPGLARRPGAPPRGPGARRWSGR